MQWVRGPAGEEVGPVRQVSRRQETRLLLLEHFPHHGKDGIPNCLRFPETIFVPIHEKIEQNFSSNKCHFWPVDFFCSWVFVWTHLGMTLFAGLQWGYLYVTVPNNSGWFGWRVCSGHCMREALHLKPWLIQRTNQKYPLSVDVFVTMTRNMWPMIAIIKVIIPHHWSVWAR